MMDDALDIDNMPRLACALAKRGFGPTCGSLPFWKGKGDPDIGVSLGALDGPTGLRLERHIFTADKGDFYDVADTAPREEQET